jgi:hypothetical protein
MLKLVLTHVVRVDLAKSNWGSFVWILACPIGMPLNISLSCWPAFIKVLSMMIVPFISNYGLDGFELNLSVNMPANRQ